MAWYLGQEGNLAAAEILFGDLNPSGKLPASFAYNLEDNPTYNSYYDKDNDLRVSYDEGIFIGYRYWDKAEKEPRFPFGYGLSYTQFEFSNISVDKDKYSSGETVKVTVDVKNIGKVDGAEVVQLYVSDKESALPRPVKELKGFEKVNLKSGETKTIAFELNKADFSYFDPDKKDWVLEPGEFEILIGSSSKDITQSATITID